MIILWIYCYLHFIKKHVEIKLRDCMDAPIIMYSNTYKRSKELYLYYYLRGFPRLRSSFFQFKNAPTPLCLSRDKTKRQSGKNATLTLTKTLPKKQGQFVVDFQITLSIYKLDYQNKNYIYKIKTIFLYYYLRGFSYLDSSFSQF